MAKNIFWILLLISCGSFAQTKKIAHRSHSGQDVSMDYEGDDNFGLPAGYRDTLFRKREKQDTATKKPAIDSTKKNEQPLRKKQKARTKPMIATLPKKQKLSS